MFYFKIIFIYESKFYVYIIWNVSRYIGKNNVFIKCKFLLFIGRKRWVFFILL